MPKLTLLTVYCVLFDRRMEKGKLWKCGTEICSNRGGAGHVGSTARLELLRVKVNSSSGTCRGIHHRAVVNRYNVLHPSLRLRSVSLKVALGGMFNNEWSLASPRVSGQGPWYAVTHRWQLELFGGRS